MIDDSVSPRRTTMSVAMLLDHLIRPREHRPGQTPNPRRLGGAWRSSGTSLHNKAPHRTDRQSPSVDCVFHPTQPRNPAMSAIARLNVANVYSGPVTVSEGPGTIRQSTLLDGHLAVPQALEHTWRIPCTVMKILPETVRGSIAERVRDGRPAAFEYPRAFGGRLYCGT